MPCLVPRGLFEGTEAPTSDGGGRGGGGEGDDDDDDDDDKVVRGSWRRRQTTQLLRSAHPPVQRLIEICKCINAMRVTAGRIDDACKWSEITCNLSPPPPGVV